MHTNYCIRNTAFEFRGSSHRDRGLHRSRPSGPFPSFEEAVVISLGWSAAEPQERIPAASNSRSGWQNPCRITGFSMVGMASSAIRFADSSGGCACTWGSARASLHPRLQTAASPKLNTNVGVYIRGVRQVISPRLPRCYRPCQGIAYGLRHPKLPYNFPSPNQPGPPPYRYRPSGQVPSFEEAVVNSLGWSAAEPQVNPPPPLNPRSGWQSPHRPQCGSWTGRSHLRHNQPEAFSKPVGGQPDEHTIRVHVSGWAQL
jgi:hypothetical protein